MNPSRQVEALAVEVTRGTTVESRHRVDMVAVDADGAVVAAAGDADRPVFPRSAIKALQALPLVETGAADAFAFDPPLLALACSSHNAEAMHVEGAVRMLAAAGCDPDCLECGPQYPALDRDRDALARDGLSPLPVHNNCSGKHSGFIAFASHLEMPVAGYAAFGSPVQRVIAGTLEAVTGATHGENNYGIDGCSIPTWAVPLRSLATGFARLAAAEDPDRARAAAMVRLRDACMAHPEMVAGTARYDTVLMRAMGGRVFSKSGAEGVLVVALPETGIGIAVKCRDGAERAAQVAMAATIRSLIEVEESVITTFNQLENPGIVNRRGLEVGEIRMADRR